jgi:hypothetical protein
VSLQRRPAGASEPKKVAELVRRQLGKACYYAARYKQDMSWHNRLQIDEANGKSALRKNLVTS